MKTSTSILLVILVIAGGAFAFKKLNRPEASTSRTPAQENIKRIKKEAFVKPSDAELKKILTPLQYDVTQHDATERPRDNEYWDNKREGIYVDIVSGEPLFSSQHKYKSGTGWPSFYETINKDEIVEKVDKNPLIGTRTEIRSKSADSHLGHVFNDGPAPTGLRYCMNSASMRFVPKEKLDELGYPEYKRLFEGTTPQPKP